jgi:hypothetical protein
MRDLPPPLPPGERTIGQLIAESIRAYGNRFWAVLPLGIPFAAADQLVASQPTAGYEILIYLLLGPLFVAAYIRACTIIYGAAVNRTAVLVALLIWVPFPILRAVYTLPGLAWLAFIGLAVPAAMIERTAFRDSLIRGRILGTADYVHSLGSLATLVLVVGIASLTLTQLLHSQSGAVPRIALLLADLVLSPLLYLGGALLYGDQAARVGSPRSQRRRRRDADLHPPLDVDPAGRPDPESQS